MSLKLKVPPALVTLICALLMWGVDEMAPMKWDVFMIRKWLALAVFGIGTSCGVAGVLSFYRRSTTINPHKPEQVTTFIQSGIYQRSRNPMYLGLLFMLISLAIYLGNPLSLVVLPIFVGYMNQFQIKPEEESMRQQFGRDYQEYCNDVRRWI